MLLPSFIPSFFPNFLHSRLTNFLPSKLTNFLFSFLYVIILSYVPPDYSGFDDFDSQWDCNLDHDETSPIPRHSWPIGDRALDLQCRNWNVSPRPYHSEPRELSVSGRVLNSLWTERGIPALLWTSSGVSDDRQVLQDHLPFRVQWIVQLSFKWMRAHIWRDYINRHFVLY